jgi:two-component system sensor histidine kinase ChiS
MNEASMETSENVIKLSHIIYLLSFIFLLVTVRWYWYDQLSLPNPPTVKQGVLDLRGVELEPSSSFPLDGEWLFYPGQWRGASNIDDALHGQMLQGESYIRNQVILGHLCREGSN